MGCPLSHFAKTLRKFGIISKHPIQLDLNPETVSRWCLICFKGKHIEDLEGFWDWMYTFLTHFPCKSLHWFSFFRPNLQIQTAKIRTVGTRWKIPHSSFGACWGGYHGPNLQVHDRPRRRQRPPLPEVPAAAASPTRDGPQQLAGAAPKLGLWDADLAGKKVDPKLGVVKGPAKSHGTSKISYESHGLPRRLFLNYPLVIKHGVLENGPLIGDPPIKTSIQFGDFLASHVWLPEGKPI